jgi:hypothetical protein
MVRTTTTTTTTTTMVGRTEQVGSSGNASGLYSGGARFESQPGHPLSGGFFFLSFVGPSRRIPGWYFAIDYDLPSPFEFTERDHFILFSAK